MCIRDRLKDWDGEVIRLALLKAHYRSELVWTEELLKESKAQLDGWYAAMSNYSHLEAGSELDSDATFNYLLDLSSDLNAPKLLAVINSEFRSGNSGYLKLITEHKGQLVVRGRDRSILQLVTFQAFNTGLRAANLLGLLQKSPEDWFKGGMDTDKYDQLVKDYDAARSDAIEAKKAGDKAKMGELFARSDTIRDELQSEGIAIETGPEGSSWRKA